MGQQEPRKGHLRQLPDVAAGLPEPAPSRVAQQRLTGALRDRADVYRADACLDLALVDVLVRMDQLEAAARTLDDHRASLRAMAQDLQVVVADAAVEREAERVYDACLRQLRSGAAETGHLRRRVVALTGAAAVFVALLLPSTRMSPRTILASIEDRVTHDEIAAARSRLDAARSTAQAVRAEQHAPAVADAPALDDPAVRKQVRDILAADQGESAALSAEPVTVLAKVRAARDRSSSRGEAAAPAGGDDLAPVVPLRRRESAPAPQGMGPGPDPDADGDSAVPDAPIPPGDAPVTGD